MLDRIADWFLKIVTAVPAWIIDEDTPNFVLFRVMLGFIVVLFVAYLFAIRRK